MTGYEPSYEKQLQSQTLATVYQALGGLHIYGSGGSPAVVIDDTASVRRTQRHSDGEKRWLYTTNVTVSVSRVELTGEDL